MKKFKLIYVLEKEHSDHVEMVDREKRDEVKGKNQGLGLCGGGGSREERPSDSVDIDTDICVMTVYLGLVHNPCLLGERLMCCVGPNFRPKHSTGDKNLNLTSH